MADGYQIRVNGGTPIDVGNVLNYDITGLTPETEYTVEIRSFILSPLGARIYGRWSPVRTGTTTEGLAAPIRIDAGRISGGTVSGWLEDDFALSGTPNLSTGVGSPDTTGVVDPAPDTVYTILHRCETVGAETYRITGLSANKPHKIRYHTCFVANGYRNLAHEYPVPLFKHALFDEVYQVADIGKARIYEGSMLSDSGGEVSLSISGYAGSHGFCCGLEIIQVAAFTLDDLADDSASNNSAYSEQLTSPLGVVPITFEIRRGDGALPKGMTLSSSGLLSGTPVVYRPSQIIAAGDSRTAGDGTADQNQTRWPSQLGLLLGGQFSIVNIAGGGAQMANMATAYTTSALPLRDTAMAKDIYILMGGRNDIDAGRSATDIYNDIAAQCAQAQSDGFLVIVSTIGFDGTFDGTKETKRSTINSNIVSNWATFADALFDADDYAELSAGGPDGSPVNYFYMAFDAVHYQAPGWGVIAGGMKDLVHGLAPNGASSSLLSSANFDFTVTAIDDDLSITSKDYTLTVTP